MTVKYSRMRGTSDLGSNKSRSLCLNAYMFYKLAILKHENINNLDNISDRGDNAFKQSRGLHLNKCALSYHYNVRED